MRRDLEAAPAARASDEVVDAVRDGRAACRRARGRVRRPRRQPVLLRPAQPLDLVVVPMPALRTGSDIDFVSGFSVKKSRSFSAMPNASRLRASAPHRSAPWPTQHRRRLAMSIVLLHLRPRFRPRVAAGRDHQRPRRPRPASDPHPVGGQPVAARAHAARAVRAAPGRLRHGIVQATSIAHDDAATVARGHRVLRDLRRARRRAKPRAGRTMTSSSIVGDIPPLAFEVAARLGVPVVAIANFTWDWIYETHPGFCRGGAQSRPRSARRTDRRRSRWSCRSPVASRCSPRSSRSPLVARQPTRSARRRAHTSACPADRPVALLSFGGYGLPALDSRPTLDCASDWTVVDDRIASARLVSAAACRAHVAR